MDGSKASVSGQTADTASQRGQISRAAGLLGSLTFLSRLSGLFRDVVIGALFGSSAGADAFFVAFRIPNLFRRIVAEGAASTAFVPVFTSYLRREGKAGALAAAAAVGGVAVVVLIVIAALGSLFAAEVVALFAPGFAADPAKQGLAVSLTRLIFPYLVLVGMAAWAMGTLNTFRRFAAPALGPILLNLSIVAAALFLSPRFEEPVYALAVGVLVGGVCQVLVQWPSLHDVGLRLSMMVRPLHTAVGRVGGLLGPTLLGGAVYQINILVATLFASLLPTGSVSWLWYADRIFEFPLGIVAVAVGTAALPSLSDQAARRSLDEMADSVSYALRLVWALTIPAMIGLWVLAPAIVSLLFERGGFDARDSAMTSWALRAYLPGLLAVASVRVLVTPFYALQKPRLPVMAAVVALFVNAAADLAFMGPTDPSAPWWAASTVASLTAGLGVYNLGHAGLALGTAIAAIVNAVVLVVMLRTVLPGPRLFACLGGSVLRHTVAAVVMGLALLGWQWLAATVLAAAGVWVLTLGGVVVGLIVYLAVAVAVGSREIRDLIGQARSGLVRRFR